MINILVFSLLSLEAWCGKITRHDLFLHSRIAADFDLHSKAQKGYFSKSLNGPVSFTDAEYDTFESWFADPALGYMCRHAVKTRAALYNSGRYRHYLKRVKDVWQLDAFVTGEAALSLIKESKDVMVLFMQDALLLFAVSEYVGDMKVKELSQVLFHVLSLSAGIMSFHWSQILHDYTFVYFANFMETVKPVLIEYALHSSILGRINADRLVRLMETHRKGVYDLSKVCSFLESYHVSQKLAKFFELKDDGLNLYTRSRVKESSLIYHVTEYHRMIGYIFKAPKIKALLALYSLDQVVFELNHLLPFTNAATRESSRSMAEEFAKLKSIELAEYVRAWLDLWKYAFCHGLTEVLHYQFIPNEPSIIRDKLRALKLYFCNNKRLNDVLQLEHMFEALMARSELLIAYI